MPALYRIWCFYQLSKDFDYIVWTNSYLHEVQTKDKVGSVEKIGKERPLKWAKVYVDHDCET